MHRIDTRAARVAVALAATVAALVLAVAWPAADADGRAADPLAFFHPFITLDLEEHHRLDRGGVVVRVLPARDGEVGIFAASRIDAPPDRLVVWTRAIGELKKSRFVLAIGRLSDPPVPEDLDRLHLDQEDLDAIRRCRPADCELKLAAEDMESLRMASVNGKSAVQQEFRRLLLQRVNAYRAGGLAGLPPYADHRGRVLPREAFASILAGSPYLQERLPDVTSRLLEAPRSDESGSGNFLYWSKEQYGTGKAVVAITHAEIIRPAGIYAPAVLVLSKEIYATHYRNTSLGMTAILDDVDDGVSYLVYVNRSHVDVLGGLFGALKRTLVEGRLRSEGEAVLRVVRARLEGGDPEVGSRFAVPGPESLP